MVHQSMRNGLKVADELNIQRVLMALEEVIFFSLYSFSCTAKEVMTLKQLRLFSWPDLFSTIIERLVLFSEMILLSPISPTLNPAQCTRTRLITSYLICNMPIFLKRVWQLCPTLFCFGSCLSNTKQPLNTHLRRLRRRVITIDRIWYQFIPL